MSDFFITNRNADQSIIDGEFNPAPPQPEQRGFPLDRLGLTPAQAIFNGATDLFDINWAEPSRGAARSVISWGGGGLSDFLSHPLNIPNNALETPDYLIRGTEGQRLATDPRYNDRTAAAKAAEDLRDYLRSTARPGQIFARDPRPQSEATQLLTGLAEVIAPAVLGSVLGPAGPAGALAFSTEERTYTDMIDRGVREEVARGAALQDAGIMAAMAVAPVSTAGTGRTLLTRLLQRGVSGAGINLAFGAAMRGNMNAYLTAQGYPEIAREYQYIDQHAMLIDGIMGAVFGATFGHSIPNSAEPHITPRDGESRVDASEPQPLPQDADGFFEEARQYGNDQQMPEAYAYALIARELGHPEADGLIARMEEEADAADLDQGRAIASEIVDANLAEGLRGSDIASAAILESGRINEETAFGIPENQASRRWQSEALSRMEEQAARDEPIDPGPVPEDVSFVPLPDTASEHWDAAMRAFEEEARDSGLSDVEAELRRLREERPDLFDPEGNALFSRRRGRGDEAWRGSERFYDDRLNATQNKAVEMARNNYRNAEIADELDTSAAVVRQYLNTARQMGIEIEAGRTGVAGGVNPRTGEPTATIEEIVGLYNRLSRRGYRNWKGRPPTGARSLNQVIAERLRISPTSVKTRLSRYNAEVREGLREPLYSQGGEGFSTVDELISAAEREFGADWNALTAAGKVEVVQSSADVPAPMGLPRGVQAVHMRDTRTTYFIANNVLAADMRGLVLHEIGVHHGMESLLGTSGYKEVLRQVDRMVGEDHPALVEARAFAERYSNSPDHVPEETLAYLIETHADLPLVKRVLSRLRQWLVKTFGSTFGMRLTVDDLRALAITSLRRVAEQARREAGDAVEVRPVQEAIYASQRPDAGGVQPSQLPDGGSAQRGNARQSAVQQALSGKSPEGHSLTAERVGVRDAVDPTKLRGEGAFVIDHDGGLYDIVSDAFSSHQEFADRLGDDAPPYIRVSSYVNDRGEVEIALDVEGDVSSDGNRGGGSVRALETAVKIVSDRNVRDATLGALGDAVRDVRGKAEVLRALRAEHERMITRAQPNAGGDFPQFSMRQDGQNGENLVGAKRDPIESPDYQRRLAEVRTRAKEGGYDETGEPGSAGLGGVRRDANAGRSAGSNPASSPRPPRALIRDVLELSGIRLETKAKSVGFGSYRATIDTPFPSDADAALHGTQGVASYVDFDIRDGSNKSDAYPGVHIRLTSLNHAARGQKVSVWLYRQIIEWADRQGMPVYSDHVSISPEAQRTYAALRRRGYDIEVIARNADKDADGYIVNPDIMSETPIFRVSKIMPIDEALTGAGHPEGDYQIDGPSLRERQQRIDEQRARQEQYDKLSGAEQAIADDPDMPLMTDMSVPMFSRGGPKRRYTARQAMEDARLEAERAAEMRKGFEAAARCAARRGAEQAARASVVTAGVIAESTPASMLGHTLGLAMAVPFGITAAPIISQNANPRRYAEGRLRAAAENLADAEARRSRNAAQAGRNAGLDAPTTYDTPNGEPLIDNVDTSRRAGDTAQFPEPDPQQRFGGGNSHRPLDYETNTFSSTHGLEPPTAKDQPRPESDAETLARLFDIPEEKP